MFTLKDNATAEVYKNTPINFFGRGYTVFFDGDELYFSTIQDAKDFIDKEVER